MLSFLLVNVSYFLVLPLGTIDRSNTVLIDFGRQVAGNWGVVIGGTIVTISCLGALNGSSLDPRHQIESLTDEDWTS